MYKFSNFSTQNFNKLQLHTEVTNLDAVIAFTLQLFRINAKRKTDKFFRSNNFFGSFDCSESTQNKHQRNQKQIYRQQQTISVFKWYEQQIWVLRRYRRHLYVSDDLNCLKTALNVCIFRSTNALNESIDRGEQQIWKKPLIRTYMPPKQLFCFPKVFIIIKQYSKMNILASEMMLNADDSVS